MNLDAMPDAPPRLTVGETVQLANDARREECRRCLHRQDRHSIEKVSGRGDVIGRVNTVAVAASLAVVCSVCGTTCRRVRGHVIDERTRQRDESSIQLAPEIRRRIIQLNQSRRPPPL
jgi:hypothetical protein